MSVNFLLGADVWHLEVIVTQRCEYADSDLIVTQTCLLTSKWLHTMSCGFHLYKENRAQWLRALLQGTIV